MSRPVTVVVPSYNHARFLPETLGSVLSQDIPDLHLHILDDGSTDDSVAVAEDFLSRHGNPRCRLSARPNRGCSATLNELIAGVQTEWVAILNSDDAFEPGRLAGMLAQATPGAPFFGFSRVRYFGEAGPEDFEWWDGWYGAQLRQAVWMPTPGFALLRANLAVSSSNFVFSRDIFDRVGGFREGLPLVQDWDFLLRAVQVVEPTFFPDPWLRYRVHPHNTYRQLVDIRTQQLQRVMDGYAGWAGTRTGNPTAPTALNWPRFFPVFARSCVANFDRVVGTRLPPALVQRPATPHAAPSQLERDTAALDCWIRYLRETQDPGAPTMALADAAAACGAKWGLET